MFETRQQAGGPRRPGTKEMTALLAGLMALNSFAIDAMIPALPAIAADLNVPDENARQLVVIIYLVGFGSTQLIWGPLADRFGRKPIMAAGLILYAAFAVLCGLAHTFPLLLAARALQGASAAVTRVLVVAMVRDLFEGEAMARVMSLVFMTFMVVPVLAPTIGQAILLVAPWRGIFMLLAAYGIAMLAWSTFRLPETLHPEYRRSLKPRDMASAAWAALTERQSLGYTLALTLTFGTLTAYIASIQQIVFDVFNAGQWIGLVFGGVAAPMALASWTNSRIVERYGLRRVGHIGIAGFAAVASTHALVALLGFESLWVFVGFQSLTMAFFAFSSSNLGALAMERMGAIAGTASSVQGVIGTIGGAAIGFAIGQAFDGTVQPFLWGIAGCSLIALLIVFATEPKRLFARVRIDSQDPIVDPCIPEDFM